MRDLKPEELRQRTLEKYQDVMRISKEIPKNELYKGLIIAYRDTLNNMGYKWKELIDMGFVNKEIQRLREEH